MNNESYKYNLQKHINNYNPYKISKYIYKINNELNLQEGGGIRLFNKETKEIEYRDVDFYCDNKNKYISFDDKILQKLANKNNNKIKKILKNNNFYHLSNTPIKNIKNTKNNKKSWLPTPYSNPQGLWMSTGSAWSNFVNGYINKWTLSTYIYEIELNDSVLHIINLEQFKNFIDYYKNNDDIIRFDNIINWDKVKNDYDGLIIYPYLGDEIWGINSINFGFYGNGNVINNYIINAIGQDWKKHLFFLAEWYRHWETSTGVVWSKTGIKNFKLIKRLNTFDRL